VWNGTRGRIIATSGANIVTINPDTGAIEDTLDLGVTAGRIAVTEDGKQVYAAIGSLAVIRRYRLDTHVQDLEIPLGTAGEYSTLATAESIVVLPGQPNSILISRGVYYPPAQDPFPRSGIEVVVYDGAVRRATAAAANVSSLYIRNSNAAIYGAGGSDVYQFAVTAAGVTITRTASSSYPLFNDSFPTWND